MKTSPIFININFLLVINRTFDTPLQTYQILNICKQTDVYFRSDMFLCCSFIKYKKKQFRWIKRLYRTANSKSVLSISVYIDNYVVKNVGLKCFSSRS